MTTIQFAGFAFCGFGGFRGLILCIVERVFLLILEGGRVALRGGEMRVVEALGNS